MFAMVTETNANGQVNAARTPARSPKRRHGVDGLPGGTAGNHDVPSAIDQFARGRDARRGHPVRLPRRPQSTKSTRATAADHGCGRDRDRREHPTRGRGRRTNSRHDRQFHAAARRDAARRATRSTAAPAILDERADEHWRRGHMGSRGSGRHRHARRRGNLAWRRHDSASMTVTVPPPRVASTDWGFWLRVITGAGSQPDGRRPPPERRCASADRARSRHSQARNSLVARASNNLSTARSRQSPAARPHVGSSTHFRMDQRPRRRVGAVPDRHEPGGRVGPRRSTTPPRRRLQRCDAGSPRGRRRDRRTPSIPRFSAAEHTWPRRSQLRADGAVPGARAGACGRGGDQCADHGDERSGDGAGGGVFGKFKRRGYRSGCSSEQPDEARHRFAHGHCSIREGGIAGETGNAWPVRRCRVRSCALSCACACGGQHRCHYGTVRTG